MSFTYAVNCSILFTELPLLDRAAAAAEAGFTAVEFWWPWATATPSDAEVDEFCASIASAGVQLVGLNFFAGDMPGGDRGVLNLTERTEEFRASVTIAARIAERTGCRAFNALYGNTPQGSDQAALDQVATENLLLACQSVDSFGGIVLIEPISGAPTYPLKTAAQVAAVVEAVQAAGSANVALLYDCFHLAANGDDVFAAIDDYYELFGHVQVADNPGRGEPGTGSLDIEGILGELRARGWADYVALEYKPTTSTVESFGWLPADRRGAGQG